MKHKVNKIIFLIIILVILISSIVFAKYVSERKKNALYTAGSFYFTSDLLSDNATMNTYEFEKGVDEISINIKNNIDDLRYSEVDIYYNAKITDTAGNPVRDQNEDIIQEITNNKLFGNQIDENTIKFSNLKTGSYIVTATSVNPYEKEIKANFIITDKNENIVFSVNDTINSPTAQITITTNDFSGVARISWPEGVAQIVQMLCFQMLMQDIVVEINKSHFWQILKWLFSFLKKIQAKYTLIQTSKWKEGYSVEKY